MTGRSMEVGMTPSHPGEFIRLEVIGEPGLSVAGAARMCAISDRIDVQRYRPA